MLIPNGDSRVWPPLAAIAAFIFWEFVARKLRRKRPKLPPLFHGLRLVVLIAGIAIFIAWQRGLVPPLVGFSGLGLAALFIALPELPFYAGRWFRRYLRDRNKIWRGDDPGKMSRPLG